MRVVTQCRVYCRPLSLPRHFQASGPVTHVLLIWFRWMAAHGLSARNRAQGYSSNTRLCVVPRLFQSVRWLGRGVHGHWHDVVKFIHAVWLLLARCSSDRNNNSTLPISAVQFRSFCNSILDKPAPVQVVPNFSFLVEQRYVRVLRETHHALSERFALPT